MAERTDSFFQLVIGPLAGLQGGVNCYNDFFGIDYEEQAVNISITQQKPHQYVINYVTSELKSLDSVIESRDFKRKINDLKQFRVESDYENIEVNSDKGNEAYNKANEIRSYIIKMFHV